VHIHLLNDACYISADGGRVCRPLIICDSGVPRVRDEHINKLKTGEWGFQDFLRAGEACRFTCPPGCASDREA
jgi:DNA-directed RNA polymerase III subunit RPC2